MLGFALSLRFDPVQIYTKLAHEIQVIKTLM